MRLESVLHPMQHVLVACVDVLPSDTYLLIGYTAMKVSTIQHILGCCSTIYVRCTMPSGTYLLMSCTAKQERSIYCNVAGTIHAAGLQILTS
ncbi:hypothetical protein DPMN_165624 [Dreissena polymorpha]|uniref:Uncharacterized protein n=1 Tax=Dreissena polymorpha TaxID=45954 RepID=A0A9D4F0M2_DREPO|nr:hypothetical protein DPMN_165624 [Dreissena polymorpha]